jgi:hypothetical protein
MNHTPPSSADPLANLDDIVKVDADFAGGNIVLDRMNGYIIELHQDLRDTAGDWFYWCFRVRGAGGRQLTFRFTRSWAIGVRGPAFSLDNGVTWSWLGAESVQDNSFTFAFPVTAESVRFSFGMPYLEDALDRFLGRHHADPNLRVEELCQSRKGRSVQILRLGCLQSEPRFGILLTCRHHCCEMMASYVLEGILEEILADTPTGIWLRENVAFLVVPFVDKDGVEDGDQGKNRRPHDHGQDYLGDSLYPEVAALKTLIPDWVGGRPCYGFDFHCPWIAGEDHEHIMSPSRLRDPVAWKRLTPFLERLEQTQSGPLAFNFSYSESFISWNGKAPDPDKPADAKQLPGWLRTIPNVKGAVALEIPYANASGQEVNQQSARLWGHDFAVALRGFLCG